MAKNQDFVAQINHYLLIFSHHSCLQGARLGETLVENLLSDRRRFTNPQAIGPLKHKLSHSA
jgi:hypothetical protein